MSLPRIVAGLLASCALPLTAQSNAVPFVGCASDGQIGPVEAPHGKDKKVAISAKDASRLAYYESTYGSGVLAPRGWHCFCTYGSNGSTLFVAPGPLGAAQFFSSKWKGFDGPAVQLSAMSGGTSGRFSVAATIARVFPAHRSFAQQVIAEGLEPASDFPFGPYPTDKLKYLTKEMVEYQTPASIDGIGTESRLVKSGDPISGVAILVGEEPNLLQLAVRLPPALADLAPVIVQQAEQSAAEPAQ